MLEGKFGPGTRKPLNIRHKEWKAMLNAIDNKKRPEAVFITLSTWVKPNLSISKAIGDLDANSVAIQMATEFENNVKQLGKKVKNFFDSKYFDTSSIIFIYDFAAIRAQPGKSQFIEIEINIDTVNFIDDNDDPAPNPATGKIENLSFDAFIRPALNAVNDILASPELSRQKAVTYHKTKGGR